MFPDGRMLPEEAAKYLGYTYNHLSHLRCWGTGPKFIKRGRIFYFKSDLDEWLAQGKKLSTKKSKI